MLFPCSSLKMDTLPRVLEDHKIPVAIVNSYRTIPHPHLREFVMDLNSDVSAMFHFESVMLCTPLLRLLFMLLIETGLRRLLQPVGYQFCFAVPQRMRLDIRD